MTNDEKNGGVAMKQIIIDKLVNLGIFIRRPITKEEYDQRDSADSNLLYEQREYITETNATEVRYWKTDTQNLSNEEINLLINIHKAKNIRTIKKIALFFLLIMLIGVVASIVDSVRLSGLINSMGREIYYF